MIELLFTAIASFFISLQSTSIFGGDSAEFSTVAKTWGISHPPGYPLYSLLVNILNRAVPFGTTPWKIALFSSVPTVFTAYFIYKILRLLNTNSLFAFFSSLFYLFLFPIWQYALIPEVFALHTFLISFITYLLLHYNKNKRGVLLVYASFLCGLCVSHHHIFVLLIPGWLLLLKDDLKKIVSDRRLVVKMCIGLLIGASFYLYAVIASLNHTVLDWENAKTLDGFFRLITRSSYGSFKAYSGASGSIVNQLLDVFSSFVFILIDFRPLGILIVLCGLIVARRYSKKFSLFLFASILIHLAFLFYTNFTLTSPFSSGMFERFLIPLYVLLAITFGMGVDFIYKHYFFVIDKNIKNSVLKKISSVGYFVFILSFIGIVAYANFASISYIPKLTTFDTLGKDILTTLPRNAIFSLQTDTPTFASMYYIYGLQKRQDVTFLQTGLMNKQDYVNMLKRRNPTLNIAASIRNMNDFTSFLLKNSDREYFSEQPGSFGYWVPYGLLWKYFPTQQAATEHQAELLSINEKLWGSVYNIPTLTSHEKNILHLLSVQNNYINGYVAYAKLLIVNEQYDKAKQVLKKIVHKYMIADATTRLALFNLLVITDDCTNAKKEARDMHLSQFITDNPAAAQSIVQYYKKCDSQNPELIDAQKKLTEYEKSGNTSLHSF